MIPIMFGDHYRSLRIAVGTQDPYDYTLQQPFVVHEQKDYSARTH